MTTCGGHERGCRATGIRCLEVVHVERSEGCGGRVHFSFRSSKEQYVGYFIFYIFYDLISVTKNYVEYVLLIGLAVGVV